MENHNLLPKNRKRRNSGDDDDPQSLSHAQWLKAQEQKTKTDNKNTKIKYTIGAFLILCGIVSILYFLKKMRVIGGVSAVWEGESDDFPKDVDLTMTYDDDKKALMFKLFLP